MTRWRRVAALQGGGGGGGRAAILARAQHLRALELLGVAARDSDPESGGSASPGKPGSGQEQSAL